ncbi:MAG: hypothetical protein ACLUSP_07730 [Christensenellales bacterium]
MLIINRGFLLGIIDNAEELGYKSFSRDVLSAASIRTISALTSIRAILRV